MATAAANGYSYIVLSENSSIRSLFVPGPAGRLEALLNAGSPTATHAAVVCHPHPLYGGTLHNKVVFHTMKALNSFGFPVLRFNFRGAGLSEGEHASGIGEVDDVRAALDWLEHEFTLPVVFAGFSFGAAVGLRAAYATTVCAPSSHSVCPQSRLKAGSTILNFCARATNQNFLSADRATSLDPPESWKPLSILSPIRRSWFASKRAITSSRAGASARKNCA